MFNQLLPQAELLERHASLEATRSGRVPMNQSNEAPDLIPIRNAEGRLIALLPTEIVTEHVVKSTDRGGQIEAEDGRVRVRWGRW